MKHQPYYDACQYLESLGKLDSPLEYMKERKIEDLEKYLLRMQDLLDRIGNPERGLKYIHITGTAGKGTTTALIHNMLQNAGYTVGSTSSPATTTTLERIRVGDVYIDPQVFAEIVENLKPIILDMYMNGTYGKPSYFDIMLAIALIYFKQQKCDIVILEVGMGGRYDSTNVIPHPFITAITNISYDHIHLLGDSLKQIAYEKAGIIKPESIFFTAEQNPEITNMFQKICTEQGAEYINTPSQENPNHDLARAIGARLDIDPEEIEKGIINTQLPCRFEIMQNEPLIILDGAHNLSKIVFSLEKLKTLEYQKLYVIFGAGDTKDALAMLDLVVEHTLHITLVPVVSFIGKSFSLKKMQKHLQEKYPTIIVSVDLDAQNALQNIRSEIDQNDCLLVIGSLYLAGGLREERYSTEFILEKRKSF